MIFLDNSGNMSSKVAKRPKWELIKECIAGTGTPVMDNGLEFIYIPQNAANDQMIKDAIAKYTDTAIKVHYEFQRHSILEVIKDALIKIVRVAKNADGTYSFNSIGDSFYFFRPEDAALSLIDPDMELAITTLDQFMRGTEKKAIELNPLTLGAIAITAFDGSTYFTVFRTAWTTADNDPSNPYNFTYAEAFKNFYFYEDTGRTSEPGIYVVRVSRPITDCYKPDKQWLDCHQPIDITDGDTAFYFVSLDTIYGWTSAPDIVANGEFSVAPRNFTGRYCSWDTFLYYYTKYRFRKKVDLDYTCLVDELELWGDGDTVIYNPSNEPASDGNPGARKIFKICSNQAGDTAPMEINPSKDRIGGIILDSIPEIGNTVDSSEWNNPYKDTSDSPFTIGSAPASDRDKRLDVFLRSENPLIPALDDSDFDPFEPDFGGFFDGSTEGEFLSYYQVLRTVPGVIDLYPNIHYGFMQFDKDNDCVGIDDDFPEDSDGDCIGGDLLFVPTSWADFPTYTEAGFSTASENQKIKNELREWGSVSEIAENAPLSSNLHDFWRFFYHPLIQGGGFDHATLSSGSTLTGHVTASYYDEPTDHDDSVDPSMYFNLSWPVAEGSSVSHIIQGDPFYQGGCRRNFLIYLTGGGGVGEENMSERKLQQKIIDVQYYWIEQMKIPAFSGLEMIPHGVKTFVIAFGPDSLNPKSEAQIWNMGKSSLMGEDYEMDLYCPSEYEGTLDGCTPYLIAKTAPGLMDVFSDVMEAILAGNYARSEPVISNFGTGELVDGSTYIGGVVVSTYFNIGEHKLWSGHMSAWVLPGPGETEIQALWSPEDAGDILHGISADDRIIFTALEVADGLSTNNYIEEFGINHNKDYFDPYQGDSLGDPEGDDPPTIGDNIVRLVRGGPDAAFIDGEPQDWKLGPIMRSTPQIVKKPGNFRHVGTTGYSQFMSDYAYRKPIIFVGSGHGMLHGFDLQSGAESFAYVPEEVIRGQFYLYLSSQIYGVDATPVIDDVYADFDSDPGTDPEWKTMLISGLGQGGKAYFALDITGVEGEYSNYADITDGDTDNVTPMWNFKDGYLALTTSVPIIGRTNFVSDDLPKVAAFFGGGLKEYSEPPVPDVAAKFYAVDMANGSLLWGATMLDPDTLDPENFNQVPGSPTIYDADGDDDYDWAYIGDSHGQLWKMDMYSGNTADWKACVFYDSLDDDLDCCPTWGDAGCGDASKCGEGEDFDQVPTEGLTRTPVWYTPALARGPRNKLIVYFSTGHIETNAVATASNKNYLFAMIDDTPIGSMTCGEDYAEPITPEIAGADNVYWPIQFDAGEKVISQPLITQGMLIFKTYLPLTSAACAMGTVRLWIIDYLTGGAAWGAFAGGEDPRYDENPGYSTTDISIGPDGQIIQTQLDDSFCEDITCDAGLVRCGCICIPEGEECISCDPGYVLCPDNTCAPDFSFCTVAQLPASAARPTSWGEGVMVDF
jgi:hypothetical protein